MKNLVYFLVFFLCFSSCSTSNQSDSDSVENEVIADHETEVKIVKPSVAPEESTATGTYYEYEGELEGGIPLELKFHKNEDLIKGELIYKKIGKPITIIGTKDEEGYYNISEFNKEGIVTGILGGKFETEAEDLSWYSPESRKNLKMNLKLKTEKESDFDFGYTELEGEYSYEYGTDGPAGHLNVSKSFKDSISFSLLCVTHAPGRNIASLEEGEMAIDGNKVSIDFKEDDIYDCAFDILFYKDFVRIKYIDDRLNCGFGHNAYVEGVFMKIEK